MDEQLTTNTEYMRGYADGYLTGYTKAWQDMMYNFQGLLLNGNSEIENPVGIMSTMSQEEDEQNEP